MRAALTVGVIYSDIPGKTGYVTHITIPEMILYQALASHLEGDGDNEEENIWQGMCEMLLDGGVLTQPINVAEVYTMQFLNKICRKGE